MVWFIETRIPKEEPKMEIMLEMATPSKSCRSPEEAPNPRLEPLLGKVLELGEFVEAAARQGSAAHEVEEEIWRRVLAMGREALSLFFKQVGDGDMGEEVELPDGRSVRRLTQLHSRSYQSIFGSFELPRVVYGTREGQKIEFAPLDQRLGLAQSKFSYLLQDWDQHDAVETPYAKVSRTLEKMLGFSQSIDSLERMNRKMAEPVIEYWDSLSVPPASEEGEVLVVSADGKGVPIRRPASAPAIEDHQPSMGPKPESKKMALVGATYTVDRFERSPAEVVASLFRQPGSAPKSGDRPRPQHKRLRASLARDEQGSMQPAMEEIFSWMAFEASERNRDGDKPLVLLMDGQTSLWEAGQSYISDGAIEILDLLHVTPRLWQAAYLFHPKRSAAAAQFVRHRVSRILQGEVHSVLRGLRRMATASGLSGRKRKKLERICQYFKNNRHRMQYHDYLAAGYPIATGVIEGACRHLVKDRLERAGMQWVLQGAQAMLDLRSIHLCEQWDAFQASRIEKENKRLYPHAELTDCLEWPIAA
jgi:hypothetical protein